MSLVVGLVLIVAVFTMGKVLGMAIKGLLFIVALVLILKFLKRYF